jgi:hypothetical protein
VACTVTCTKSSLKKAYEYYQDQPWNLHLGASSSSRQAATVVADRRGEGAALASILSAGVSSASHYGGGHETGECCSVLWSLGRRGPSQPLRWRTRQVMALMWPLFSLSALSQGTNVVAGTTGEGAALASVRLVGKGSNSHCSRGHDM